MRTPRLVSRRAVLFAPFGIFATWIATVLGAPPAPVPSPRPGATAVETGTPLPLPASRPLKKATATVVATVAATVTATGTIHALYGSTRYGITHYG